MKLELVIKNEARIEINDAYRYYEHASVGLGEKFFEVLDECFEGIRSSPSKYPMKKSPYREALVRKFPFIVVFEVVGTQAVVYSVFNTWRNPAKKP